MVVCIFRLYKSVEDFDVLRGIFSSRLGTQDITARAIEAEMRADYHAALKLYSKVCSDYTLAHRYVVIILWLTGMQ